MSWLSGHACTPLSRATCKRPLAGMTFPRNRPLGILEILYCTPKGGRALLRIPSTEGRSVCLCWAKSKPKGPKGNVTPARALPHAFSPSPSLSLSFFFFLCLSVHECNVSSCHVRDPKNGYVISFPPIKGVTAMFVPSQSFHWSENKATATQGMLSSSGCP